MYQLIDFNVDFLITCDKPVYLVGTGEAAVHAFKKVYIRSIQLEKEFRLAGVYSMEESWIGKNFCGAVVRPLQEVNKTDGIYLVGENEYFSARKMMQVLNALGIEQIIVTLPQMQFYKGMSEFENNKSLFRRNREKIQYVYEHLSDEKSREIWKNLLRARWDVEGDASSLYREAERLSAETGSRQYFPVEEIFPPEEEGIFIDGGALSGSSCIEFARWCRNHYHAIYTFEPDARYYELLETNLQCHHLERVKLMKMGLYDYTGTAGFSEEPIGSSKTGQGASRVPVVSIDDVFLSGPERVTYLKMDIEGSEGKALRGAEQLIHRDHPRLAVCIYHGERDIFEVPYQMIHDLGYPKVYIRHYSDTVGESVCYAKWEE